MAGNHSGGEVWRSPDEPFSALPQALFPCCGSPHLPSEPTPAIEKGAATLPAGDALTWGKEPIEDRTSQRATICLNGIWQAMPAVNDARQQPTADWGYIRVPGGWQDSGNRMPGIVAAGSRRSLAGFQRQPGFPHVVSAADQRARRLGGTRRAAGV